MENVLRDAYITLREPVNGSEEQRAEKEAARKFVRKFCDQPNAKEIVMKIIEELDKK